MMQNEHAGQPVVLITGSTGLLGTHLVKSLVDDYRVVGLDVKPPEELIPGTKWIKCDLTDDENVRDVLASVRSEFGNQIASVIHLAAYYDFSGEPSPLYDELTVEGTRRLLKALQDFDVEQFAFSSSLLVMKPVPLGERLRETSETQAEWAYPESKLKTEQILKVEHGKIPAVIARIAGVYNEDCHSLPISQQIRRIYEKQMESYFFPGNADHGQSFVHLDDVIRCFQQIIEHRGTLEPLEVFLIGEEDVMSYGELQDAIGELLHGEAWPTIRVPKAVAKAGAWVEEKLAGDDEEDKPFIKPWMVDLADAHYPVDISQARRRLEWQPEHTLRGTLPKMIERLRRDPKQWYETNGLPLAEEISQ